MPDDKKSTPLEEAWREKEDQVSEYEWERFTGVIGLGDTSRASRRRLGKVEDSVKVLKSCSEKDLSSNYLFTRSGSVRASI